MGAADRIERTAAADELCAAALAAADPPETGVALVAVGGYGRGDLAPYSDLDVVLLCDEETGSERFDRLAATVWYPLWDSGARLDHSVRTLAEMLAAASADVRVAAGLLDVRHVAGDPNLTIRLRTTILADWRRHARQSLPLLREMTTSRHRLIGELAHLSVPHLKEAEGGLRDATVLGSLSATWLVDVPAADLERCRRQLLDVRDVLHEVAGRATDRIAPEYWSGLAAGPELPDGVAAQRHVRELGRRLTHLSRLAWRRTDDALRRSSAARPRRPELRHLARGVALSRDEVVLARGARPGQDPVLLLRAAAEAAARDLVLAPPTAARLGREAAPLPDPWPAEARQQLVRMLAGPGLLPVWETLEETGALTRILPEWEGIRLLPHASVIHRFTVDRHVVETCIEAAALIRGVSRPDVLMVAALLHDIGKGGLTEHSIGGAPIARTVALRMGFETDAADLVEQLVRHHLLLARVATTRDPDDPATVEAVTDHIRTREGLDLLTALTEADAKATSPQAWTAWRAGLVHDLARRAASALAAGSVPPPMPTEEIPVPPAARTGGVSVNVEPSGDGTRVTTIAPDRLGLLADWAAVFALGRLPVRAARVWSQGEYGVSVWDLAADRLDPAVLREQLAAVIERRVDPAARLAARETGGGDLAPTVVVRPEASDQATVVEVRAGDRLGVVRLVCMALASMGISVRSAHVSTLGPQAVDVFYVQEVHAGALSETRAAEAAHVIRARLSGPGEQPDGVIHRGSS